MLRCAGTATSTFGGGGGTKLFCSQALNATSAAMAKDPRQAAAARRLAAPRDLLQAGERAGFIPCPNPFVSKKDFNRKQGFGYPIKIATIHLQWNLKAKMMPPAKFLDRSFQISLRLKRLLRRQR
jgi:hypothetical protein